MKATVAAIVLTMCVNAIYCQVNTTLNFSRPTKPLESTSTINVSFEEQEINLKNGGSLAVLLPLSNSQLINIQCGSNGNFTNFPLRAIPGESYYFEVGFNTKGLYINLVSGRVDLSIPLTQTEEDSDATWQTNANIDRKDLSIGLKAEKTHSSDAIRQEWIRKGGKISYLSATYNYVYFKVTNDKVGDITGNGFGFSFYYNSFNLKIPEYTIGTSKWNSFTWGLGYDGLFYKTEMTMSDELYDMYITNNMVSLIIAANLGWTLGIGKFKTEEQWKGLALIFKYRPSLTIVGGSSEMNMVSHSEFVPNMNTTTQLDPNVNFNFGGFGFDIQMSNYYATLNKIAPKPSLKLTAFLIPPIGDTPLFINIGLGINIYRK